MALSEADILRRRTCIGSSDMARIITGKFGGESAVIAEKVLETAWEGDDLTKMGSLAENEILRKFSEDTGAVLTHTQCVAAYSDPVCQATIDAITDSGNPVEAKLVFPWSKAEWQNEFGDYRPSDYAFIQSQYQQMCQGVNEGYVTAWFLTEGHHHFTVKRDNDLCEALYRRALEVMERVKSGQICPQGMEATMEIISEWNGRLRNALSRRQPVEGHLVSMTEGQGKLVDLWDKLRVAKTALEKPVDALRDILLLAMGDADTAILADGRQITRSIQAECEIAAYTRGAYPVLRIHKAKKTKKEEADE